MSHAADDGRRIVRIGFVDTFSPEFYIDTYARTVQYLKHRLPQYRFQSVEFSNPSELTPEKVASLDFLVSSAGTFGIRARELGAEHIVIRKRADTKNAAQSTSAVFVVRADRRDLQTLADLKNKSVSATNESSFSGWLVALDEIALSGFAPDKFFSSVQFTEYNYPDVISRVLVGKTDVGILTPCELEGLSARGVIDRSRFKVINAKHRAGEACVRSTELYPGEVISAFPHTSGEVAKAMTVALLLMPPQTTSNSPWEWVTVNDLVNISGLTERLALGPYSYRRDFTVTALARRYSKEIVLALALVLAVLFHIVRVNALVRLRTRELVQALAQKEELMERGKRTQDYLNLLERNQIVTHLSSLFAHEMTQPVTNIINYSAGLEMLRKAGQSNDAMTAQALGAISDQARRIAEIVERVRAYAKHRPLAKTTCRLLDVVRTMLENLRLAKKSGAAIEVDVDAAVFVKADAVALELLLLNLVRNAQRAVADVPDPRIWIKSTQAGNIVRVTVSDNGPSVDEALFQKLGRVGGVHSSTGLGMGLAIANGIAENHNGHLEFSRSVGGGLAVTLVMHALQPEEEVDENTSA